MQVLVNAGRLVLATLGLALAGAVHAQAFPTRPVTLIVPYAVGGITDVAFRALAVEMGKNLGQTIVVDNKVGGGGKIGARAIFAAAKDGYTIGVLNSGLGTNSALTDPGFAVQPGRDYAPLSRVLETYIVLITSPTGPFKDVKALVDFAKTNPGKVNLASSGLGTSGHLAIELLKILTGINVVHVPYKGENLATNDVIGGQVQGAFVSAVIKPLVTSGKLAGLAVTSSARWSAFPDLPTLRESVAERFDVTAWQGLIGPAGMPPEVVSRLNRAIVTALQQPGLRKIMEDLGLVVGTSSPEEFAAFIRKDNDFWRPVFAQGIKME